LLDAGSGRRRADLALGRVREIVLLQHVVHDEVRSSEVKSLLAGQRTGHR
jgi:hypothetical protein